MAEFPAPQLRTDIGFIRCPGRVVLVHAQVLRMSGRAAFCMPQKSRRLISYAILIIYEWRKPVGVGFRRFLDNTQVIENTNSLTHKIARFAVRAHMSHTRIRQAQVSGATDPIQGTRSFTHLPALKDLAILPPVSTNYQSPVQQLALFHVNDHLKTSIFEHRSVLPERHSAG